MKFKKLESGRSMVEMLGVLAIIGVLSVGGIAGYSLGMRKHRANGVVDVASKYAVVGYNQCQQKLMNGEITGETINYTDWNGGNGYKNTKLIKGCFGEYDGFTSFEDAGVGNKPAGVTGFTEPFILHDPNTGDDTVVVSIGFDDDKLCQAVASTSGVLCYEGYTTAVKIKQN